MTKGVFRHLFALGIFAGVLAGIWGCSPDTATAASGIATGKPVVNRSSRDLPRKWTNYQRNDGNNAVISGNFRYEWSFDPHARINGSLAVVGRTVFVDTFAKKLYAIDITDGKPRWTAKGQGVMMSTPIVAGGLVYVGTGTNHVLKDSGNITVWGRPGGDFVDAFDMTTGQLVWSYKTIGEDMPTPALIGNRLIFGNGDMHAYALDARTGQLIWKVPLPGITTMSATATAPGEAILVASRGIDYFFAKNASHVIAISPQSGRILWSSIRGNSDCSPTVTGAIVVCEGTINVLYGNNQGGYMGRNDIDAYDAQTGKRLWRWLGDVGYFPAVGSNERGIAGMAEGGILYQSVPTLNEMVAIRISNGKLLWKFHTAGAVKMSPVSYGGSLIFGDTAGMLYAVSMRTGTIQGLVSERLPFTTSAPIVFGKTVLIADYNRLLAVPVDKLGLI